MRRDLLETLMVATGALAPFPEQPGTIQVIEDPQHTENLFGPISEIAGKQLQLLSRNPHGDCLCIFHGEMGTNIVDVDHRDVKP